MDFEVSDGPLWLPGRQLELRRFQTRDWQIIRTSSPSLVSLCRTYFCSFLPPLCRQASTVCLVPYHRKHGLAKILEFTWHASSQQARDQIFFFFDNVKIPGQGLWFIQHWSNASPWACSCWKDTFLPGASSVGGAGGVSEGYPGRQLTVPLGWVSIYTCNNFNAHDQVFFQNGLHSHQWCAWAIVSKSEEQFSSPSHYIGVFKCNIQLV